MNEVKINGHSLPKSLMAAIENDKWPPSKEYAEAIRPPVQDTKYFRFLSIAEMIRETKGLRDLPEMGCGLLNGLTNGKEHKEGFLNVDYAVIIADSRDEDIVVLDYFVGLSPRVVAIQDCDTGVAWVEVAESFDAFLERLEKYAADQGLL